MNKKVKNELFKSGEGEWRKIHEVEDEDIVCRLCLDWAHCQCIYEHFVVRSTRHTNYGEFRWLHRLWHRCIHFTAFRLGYGFLPAHEEEIDTRMYTYRHGHGHTYQSVSWKKKTHSFPVSVEYVYVYSFFTQRIMQWDLDFRIYDLSNSNLLVKQLNIFLFDSCWKLYSKGQQYCASGATENARNATTTHESRLQCHTSHNWILLPFQQLFPVRMGIFRKIADARSELF